MNEPSPLELTIVHLEDEDAARKQFRSVFPAMKKRLSDFLTHTLSYTDAKSARRDYSPKVRIKLVQYASVPQLVEALVDDGRPTSAGMTAALFVFDHFIRDPRSDPHLTQDPWPLPLIPVAGESGNFARWIGRVFPHIPIVLLTGKEPEETSRPPEWDYVPKNGMKNEEEFVKALANLFPKWWQPTFAAALAGYGSGRGAGSQYDDRLNSGAGSWHTPGHNLGNAFARSPVQKAFYLSYGSHSFQTDLSVSVDWLGDLSEPDLDSPLKKARELSSQIFGAEETFFVTNGTSSSNKAMLMTLLRPGEVVLLDRNCHKSVHQAVVMSGALPLYLQPVFHEELGIWPPLSRETLLKFLKADYPEQFRPRMLVLTTCTYEGMIYPIYEIAATCEERGILFFADEAWAPYLRFHPYYSRVIDGTRRRYNAIDGGAHFSVQSTHKALAAFSQASMIHVGSEFKRVLEDSSAQWSWLRGRFSLDGFGSYPRFRHHLMEILRYWHSTSPHYPMMATLDRAGIQMRLEGMKLLEERIRWVEEFTQIVDAAGGARCVVTKEDIVDHLPGGYEEYVKDPLKLILAFRHEQDGDRFTRELKSERLQWEKSSSGCVEFLVTIGTYKDHLQKLKDVVLRNRSLLGVVEPRGREKHPGAPFCSEQIAVLPRDAAACIGELILLDKSHERVSAQMLVPYPPGIPVLLPGLRITNEMINIIQKTIMGGGVHDVHGIFQRDGRSFVKVMTQEEVARSNEASTRAGTDLAPLRQFAAELDLKQST